MCSVPEKAVQLMPGRRCCYKVVLVVLVLFIFHRQAVWGIFLSVLHAELFDKQFFFCTDGIAECILTPFGDTCPFLFRIGINDDCRQQYDGDIGYYVLHPAPAHRNVLRFLNFIWIFSEIFLKNQCLNIWFSYMYWFFRFFSVSVPCLFHNFTTKLK